MQFCDDGDINSALGRAVGHIITCLREDYCYEALAFTINLEFDEETMRLDRNLLRRRESQE